MGGDGMTEDEFAELSAGHALGALSAADEARFLEALEGHPARRRLADLDIATAAELAADIGDVAPPPQLRSSLLAQLDDVRQDGALSPDAPVSASQAASVDEVDAGDARHSVAARSDVGAAGSDGDAVGSDAGPSDARVGGSDAAVSGATPRARGRRLWFALAASLTLLLAVGAGTIAIVTNLTRPAAVYALERIEAAPDAQTAEGAMPDGGVAEVHWSPSLGEAVFVAEDMPTLDADQSYELWFVRDGAPISAGVFEAPEGAATAVLEGDMKAGDIVAVTVEPAGGSPTGEPSSDPILAIETA